MTFEPMTSAPKDGSTLKLRSVRSPSHVVTAHWADGKWTYERRDGVVVMATDASFDGWRKA